MPDVDWTVGGSWRRMAETIGDLDIMIVTPDGTLNDVELPRSFHAQHQGPQVVQGDLVVGEDSIHVDFWSCKPEARGAFLMFITGPKALNIMQRRRALDRGMTLSQYGLFDHDKNQLDNGTEVSIYSLLGMPWLRPVDREAFANKPPTPERKPHSVKVRSDSDPSKEYTVTVTGDYWTCTCYSFMYSKSIPGTCKHIKRLRPELEAALRARGTDLPREESNE